MTERRPAEVFPPGEFLRDEIEERGWTQSDLAEILGRPLQAINEIIVGKKAITPETARGLADALGTSPELWLNLESSYQLWKARDAKTNDVALRAKLYSKAPVREMIKRGWIEPSRSAGILERHLCAFYGIDNIDQEPSFLAFAARMSASYWETTPAQRAWLTRAHQLAPSVQAARYSPRALPGLHERLHEFMRDPEDVRRVPAVLAEAGIRLLIIEPLPGTKIDGACLWQNGAPIVVISMRYDRIDAFWYTLMHELAHVSRKDGSSGAPPLDMNLIGASPLSEKPEHEIAADQQAAEALIPQEDLDGFISRVSPLYYKAKIRGFAAIQGVHPGIVVGQLQHRGEIDWAHSRDLLVKVRDVVIQSALTDGWGNRHAVRA